MQKDLRMTELEMQITSVAINPLGVASGLIELTKPRTGKAEVLLTEADINRAFNSEYVRDKLKNYQISVNGQETAITPQYIDFHLPGERKVVLNASILLRGTGETKQVGFSAVLYISANGKNISLKILSMGKVKKFHQN
ncbi:LmeA family phospholipid-binding protein [Trichormus azollae]|uniref:LmeA family phospholipid-binding protein n=1 Tax=Trichormus azollae TaxID=1164 RepID=UPI003D356745